MTMQIEKPQTRKEELVISDIATAAIKTRRCVKMNLEELVKMYNQHPDKLEALMRMKL